jgi:hypothetical protein
MATQSSAQEGSRSTEASTGATKQKGQIYPMDTQNPSSVAAIPISDRTDLNAPRGSQNRNEASKGTFDASLGRSEEIQSADHRETQNTSPANAVHFSTPEPQMHDDGGSSSDKSISQEDLLKSIHDKLPSAEILSSLAQH